MCKGDLIEVIDGDTDDMGMCGKVKRVKPSTHSKDVTLVEVEMENFPFPLCYFDYELQLR